MSNLSTINMHRAEQNLSGYNNFMSNSKEKPMKYNFDNEMNNYNNFISKKLSGNASSYNINGSNSKFKKVKF